jgi:hypothetical protein
MTDALEARVGLFRDFCGQLGYIDSCGNGGSSTGIANVVNTIEGV